MKKFTLFIGLNDKDTFKQEISTKKAISLIVDTVISNHLSGCTVQQSIGYYLHNNSTNLVIEKSINLIIYTNKTSQIKTLINQLKVLLNQESIIYQVENTTSKVA